MTPQSFTDTRARLTDSQTSRDAAKHAVTAKADAERRAIREAVSVRPMTAREVAAYTGIEYIECQRRISECGLVKTSERRDRCAVWAARA